MSTISVRVQPLTGRKGAGQRMHDLRDPKHIKDYVNHDKTKENSIIYTPPTMTELRAEIEQNRKSAGQQKLRTDAQTIISGIITFSIEAQKKIDALTKNQQDQLFKQVAKEIARESGHPLLSLVVHRDESAIHAHFMLRGYRKDLDGKEIPWRKSPADMKKLQDIAANVPEVAVLGIKRGKPKFERIKDGEPASAHIHRSVKQLHEDLPHEIQTIRDNLKALFKNLPAPRPVEVEIIKKKRALLPAVTEVKKVITQDQQRQWIESVKSKVAEYIAQQKTEIEIMRDEVSAKRYAVKEKLREIELINSNMQEKAALFKLEVDNSREIMQAKEITNDALSITMFPQR